MIVGQGEMERSCASSREPRPDDRVEFTGPLWETPSIKSWRGYVQSQHSECTTTFLRTLSGQRARHAGPRVTH